MARLAQIGKKQVSMNGCDGNQLRDEMIGFIMSEDCNKGSARRAEVGTGK